MNPFGDTSYLPECWLCERPVERLDVLYDNVCCWTVFVARCHGNSHRVVVTNEWLVNQDRPVVHSNIGMAVLIFPSAFPPAARTRRFATRVDRKLPE